MEKKCILIMLDGLGDRAHAVLDHQTPLQAARTPTLDRLAALGANGTYHATCQGEALPSENAHFAIFGYEPAFFPGRGPLEALGAGIPLDAADVAILAHFAAFREKEGLLVLENGKLDASPQEARQVSQAAASFSHQDIQITFTHTHKVHGIVTLKGDVSPFVTDTDPLIADRALIEPRPLAQSQDDPAAILTAAALKAYLLDLYDRLRSHPVNQSRRSRKLAPLDGLVTQRAGRLKAVEPFARRYGMQGLIMASGLVYHGLGNFLGLDCLKVDDTADPGNDLARRIESAHQALTDYDFVHVHTKVPDEAGHTKDPEGKKKAIESLDEGLAQALPPLLADSRVLVVVAADHSTPSSGPLVHSGESVPLIFHGEGIRCDAVKRFSEIDAPWGALGQVRGRELMLMVLNALDRAKLKGLMDTPVDQPFWPGDYRPFTLKVDSK